MLTNKLVKTAKKYDHKQTLFLKNIMAKIAISNLAWSRSEDEQVFSLMKKNGVLNLEISPFREFSNEVVLSKEYASEIRNSLNSYKIKVIALQALMYRFPELILFKDEQTREKTFNHMVKIINFAHHIGANTLIFGCPKNKLRMGLKYDEAFEIATNFFKRLAKPLSEMEMVCCIEPTPDIYGTDFILNTEEAISLIKAVDNDSIKLNFDLGALKINNENIEEAMFANAKYIGHIHISEPSLQSIDNNYPFHKKIAQTIRDISYSGYISIEMLPLNIDNIKNIEKILSFIVNIYE